MTSVATLCIAWLIPSLKPTAPYYHRKALPHRHRSTRSSHGLRRSATLRRQSSASILRRQDSKRPVIPTRPSGPRRVSSHRQQFSRIQRKWPFLGAPHDADSVSSSRRSSFSSDLEYSDKCRSYTASPVPDVTSDATSASARTSPRTSLTLSMVMPTTATVKKALNLTGNSNKRRQSLSEAPSYGDFGQPMARSLSDTVSEKKPLVRRSTDVNEASVTEAEVEKAPSRPNTMRSLTSPLMPLLPNLMKASSPKPSAISRTLTEATAKPARPQNVKRRSFVDRIPTPKFGMLDFGLASNSGRSTPNVDPPSTAPQLTPGLRNFQRPRTPDGFSTVASSSSYFAPIMETQHTAMPTAGVSFAAHPSPVPDRGTTPQTPVYTPSYFGSINESPESEPPEPRERTQPYAPPYNCAYPGTRPMRGMKPCTDAETDPSVTILDAKLAAHLNGEEDAGAVRRPLYMEMAERRKRDAQQPTISAFPERRRPLARRTMTVR
ncbi:hypothetical protein PLICRDRAFT_50261 [Plicaturopsis crispa FD-325 SS-3]|nr:hypothetical protein PLICRDRAFT_50261 [Plicaturopsis crispa FD-325 SS-3]